MFKTSPILEHRNSNWGSFPLQASVLHSRGSPALEHLKIKNKENSSSYSRIKKNKMLRNKFNKRSMSLNMGNTLRRTIRKEPKEKTLTESFKTMVTLTYLIKTFFNKRQKGLDWMGRAKVWPQATESSSEVPDLQNSSVQGPQWVNTSPGSFLSFF